MQSTLAQRWAFILDAQSRSAGGVCNEHVNCNYIYEMLYIQVYSHVRMLCACPLCFFVHLSFPNGHKFCKRKGEQN